MNPRCLALPLALALTISAPAVTMAQATIELRRIDYQIGGQTRRALRSAMRSVGPSLPNGERAFGFTHGTIEVHYVPLEESGLCRPAAVRVNTLITMTLPQWNDRESAPPKLQQQWAKFEAALHAHEDHHRQIYAAAGEALYQALVAAPPTPCPNLTVVVAELRRRGRLEMERQHAEYDRTTLHGRKESVRF